MMKTRATIYIRQSTCCRLSADQQEAQARAAAELLGVTVVGVWREAALTARQRRNGLPVRSRMLMGVAGHVDQIIVADVAALGRSLSDLVRFVADLENLGVDLLLAASVGEPQRRIDFRLLEMARSGYQHEASVEGRERAVANGVRLGRPSLSAQKIERARAALEAGLGIRAAALRAGVGVASVTRIRDGFSR